MRIQDDTLRSVIFVGSVGELGQFIPLGTGFFAVKLHKGYGFQQVVSCWHVVDDIPGDKVFLRINRKDGGCEIIETRKSEWYPHPESDDRKFIDLAVMPSRIPPERYDILHVSVDQQIADQHIVEREKIGVGDEIFFVGLFTNHAGETRNLPVVRCGTISAMPQEPVSSQRGFVEGFLIETHSIGGLSGSPAFAHMAPLRVIDGVVTPSENSTHYLLGVVQGHFKIQNPTDVVAQPDDETHGMYNTGIGIVVPSYRLLEAINQPELERQRDEIVEKLRKSSGLEFDSVAPLDLEPPTKADNPRHKEDFNRLLGEAVKGPQSDS